jgi:hypothetical protein
MFLYVVFLVESLETGRLGYLATPELHWVHNVLDRYGLPVDLRGDGIYVLGRKKGPVRDRWPAWLYS